MLDKKRIFAEGGLVTVGGYRALHLVPWGNLLTLGSAAWALAGTGKMTDGSQINIRLLNFRE